MKAPKKIWGENPLFQAFSHLENTRKVDVCFYLALRRSPLFPFEALHTKDLALSFPLPLRLLLLLPQYGQRNLHEPGSAYWRWSASSPQGGTRGRRVKLAAERKPEGGTHLKYLRKNFKNKIEERA